MRLERIIRYIKRNFRYIVLSAVLGGVFGLLIFYFYPFGYKATGSLFVSRRPDLIQREEFTYEGYYAQRASADYTQNVIAILESDNLFGRVLDEQGLVVNEENIRNLRKSVDVRKSASQLIYLKTKGNTKQQAEKLWNLVANEAVDMSDNLNQLEGDPNLSVQTLGEPVVLGFYRDLILFSVVGVLVGAFVSTAIIFGKSQIL